MVNHRTIEEILSSLQPSLKANFQNLRNLVKASVPEAVELVKNSKVTYKLDGKDFVWINHFQDHLDLEFLMGASLDSNLLKSRGVGEQSPNIRHAVVGNFEKEKPELERLLKEAAALGFEHCQTSR